MVITFIILGGIAYLVFGYSTVYIMSKLGYADMDKGWARGFAFVVFPLVWMSQLIILVIGFSILILSRLVKVTLGFIGKYVNPMRF